MKKTIFNTAIISQDVETGDYMVSFWQNKKDIAFFRYEFLDNEGHKVSVSSDLNTFEARREMLRVLRKKFKIANIDPETEEKLEQKFIEKLKRKLSPQEINEIEIEIKNRTKTQKMNGEEIDWLRSDLMIQRNLENESLDEEISEMLDSSYKVEGKNRLLRDTLRKKKIIEKRSEKRGWIIFYLLIGIIMIIIILTT